MVSSFDPGKPVVASKLTAEDASSIIQAARPYSGKRRDSYYMQLARQSWVNLLYYLGIQSIEVPEFMENMDPGLLIGKGNYVANHILRLVMGNVARLSSARVDWSVLPNTPDQADQDGARVGQNVLDHLHTHLALPEKRLEACLWLDITGTCFAYANWDVSKGQSRRYYTDPFSGQRMTTSQMPPGQQQWLDGMGLYVDENDGDHDSEILSLFDVWLPPRFRKLEQMPWVLIRRTMSMDEVWNRWPEEAADLPTNEPMTMQLDQYRGRIPTLAKRPGLGLSSPGDDDGAVDVDEYWHAPSKRCPEGLTIFAVRTKVLEHGPHKLAEAGLDLRFPLIDFHNIPVPGRFHSMSTVENLIGPQTDYNRARQQGIQIRDILGVPQWIAPIGTLAKGVVRNEVGDVLEYNSRIGKPELQAAPTIGDSPLVTGQLATSDMQMIASFSDASLGNMPQGARSGNAVAMLQERDQLGITPTVGALEKSFEKWGHHLLMLEWKLRKHPQAITIYGESRQADLRFFRGSDLNGNCRVQVKAGSMMPKSKAQTMELLTQLMTLGALNPADQQQQRLVLEALEVGGTERMWLHLDLQCRRARHENAMFSKPTPGMALPDVLYFDDHVVHHQEHVAFMLTDEFELMDPMLKLAFEAHDQKHVMQLAAVMEAQAAVAQVGGAGGEPGGGGGGSPGAKPLGKASPPRQNPRQPATANP